jgi:hypothetical protein
MLTLTKKNIHVVFALIYQQLVQGEKIIIKHYVFIFSIKAFNQ